MIELIPGKRYYGRWGMGWMVLVNGQPHHEMTKDGALEFINELRSARGSLTICRP